MSNRQLGWDDQRIRDRLDPSEIVQGEQAEFAQQKSEETGQPLENGDQWIPPGNKDQGSRKK
jgi:hypothetical protein